MLNTKFVLSNNDLFELKIYIPCGAINEDDDQSGISHFLEHIKFNKTTQSPTLNKEFNKAKTLGSTINAYTTMDHTTFFTSSSSKNWKTITKLLLKIVFDTKFSNNNIENERKIVFEEKAMRYDNHIAANVLDTLHLSKDNPYVTKSIIGSDKSLLNISNADLKKFNDEHYFVDNCIFLISCSNSQKEKICDFIMNFLKKIKHLKWTNEHKKIIDTCLYKSYDFNLQVNINTSSEFNRVLLNFRSFCLTNEDVCFLPVINYIVTEELYKELREDKAFVYKIYCTNDTQLHVGFTRVSFTTTYDNVSIIINKIVEIIESLSKNKTLFDKQMSSFLNKFDIDKSCYIMSDVVFSSRQIKDSSVLREIINDFTYNHFKKLSKYIFDLNYMSAMIISNNKSVDYHINMFKKELKYNAYQAL
uniref:Peptidase M16 N-terminal domain-containing protein n=1 Tax=viral metagenome TaxID=1070528 RepID=A0A6C0BPF9_9ZZZZ